MTGLPTYQRIFQDLEQMIRAGKLPSGSRLPSAASLAAHYGVAPMTVRSAIQLLVDARLVLPRRGVGTFVLEQRFHRTLDSLRGFSEEVREQGKVVVTTQCEARIVGEPPTELVEALQLRSSSKVAYLERLRIVNALPAAVQQAWIPVALCPGLFSEPLVDDSLYATFRAKYGIVLSWAEQETSAVAARDHLAQLLKVSRGSPLLYVVRKTFDDRNTPIEYVRSWMPQGHSLLSTIKA